MISFKSYMLLCGIGSTINSCFIDGGWIPILLYHLSTFYISLGLVLLGKRHNILWSKKSFRSSEEVAWHFPMILSSAYFGLISLKSVYEFLIVNNDEINFGKFVAYNENNAKLLGSFVWFITYLCVDLFIILIHNLGNFETFLHHSIFGLVSYVMFKNSCSAPFISACLITQELSTPFLNVFLLLRGYCGINHIITQLVFVLFIIMFFIFRIGLNTLATLMFLREFYRSIYSKSELIYTQGEILILSIVLTCGMLMQFYWGYGIINKLYKMRKLYKLSKED